MNQKTARIRELNDSFRKTFSGGKVAMTASVKEQTDMVVANALVEVARFSNFTEENDPHGERDFGNFQVVGRTSYWKMDLYNSTMDGGSEDPTDHEKTTRVLTLMLSEDYRHPGSLTRPATHRGAPIFPAVRRPSHRADPAFPGCPLGPTLLRGGRRCRIGKC
jgi:hypothetical protein